MHGSPIVQWGCGNLKKMNENFCEFIRVVDVLSCFQDTSSVCMLIQVQVIQRDHFKHFLCNKIEE